MKRTRSVAEVVRVLRAGGTAIVPTDTAYALAADATNPDAVLWVKRLKGRDAGKPVALIASSTAQVRKFFRFPSIVAWLARRFWPGPLTLVLQPKRALVRSSLARGGVGVRVPANATARRIVQRLGNPITATSANRSGGPTPYTPAAVIRGFRRAQPDVFLDAGRLPKRPVSTVVRLRGSRVEILRHGAIPATKLHVLR
jgi:L-threonylcarbamoyladenylate synthase